MFLAVLLLSHSAQDVYGKKKNLPLVLPPAKPSFPATEITIPMVEFPKYPETGKLELLASPRKMITTDFTSREINHIGVGDAARFQDSDTEIIDLSLIQEGDYAFPLPGAKVISPYGGRRRHHSGYDIKTCPNDTIVAAFDGVVRLSKPYSAYGNVIVIRHYNGLETVYSHNSKNLVKPGDVVKLYMDTTMFAAISTITTATVTINHTLESLLAKKVFIKSIFRHPFYVSVCRRSTGIPLRRNRSSRGCTLSTSS